MTLNSKIPATLLILLWIYTGMDKILRFETSRKAFHNQVFPSELAEILSYAVPGVELLIALLLLFSVTRWWGYLGSVLLLTVFITYVGLIWVGAFPRVPCNCAGIIDIMGWAAHFWMNLGLIGVAVWGLRTEDILFNKTKNWVKKEAADVDPSPHSPKVVIQGCKKYQFASLRLESNQNK